MIRNIPSTLPPPQPRFEFEFFFVPNGCSNVILYYIELLRRYSWPVRRSIMHVRNSVRMTPVNCQNPAWHFLFSPHVHGPSVHTLCTSGLCKESKTGTWPGDVWCRYGPWSWCDCTLLRFWKVILKVGISHCGLVVHDMNIRSMLNNWYRIVYSKVSCKVVWKYATNHSSFKLRVTRL